MIKGTMGCMANYDKECEGTKTCMCLKCCQEGEALNLVQEYYDEWKKLNSKRLAHQRTRKKE